MIIIYFIASIVFLLLLVFSRSQKLMNFISVLHAAAYFIITAIALNTLALPSYYTVKYYFSVDHFALYEVAISSLVFFLSLLYLKGYMQSLIKSHELNQKNVRLFYAAMNVLLIVATLAFFSNNLALFWIFLELTTILSAVLIVVLNAKENIYDALKYIFIASACMLFSVIGLILLYSASQAAYPSGTLNWNELMLASDGLHDKMLAAAFIFIFIGFAAKSGIFPFHTWLPHADAKAPSAVSAVLSGVLLNIGMFGIIKILAIVSHTASKPTLSWFLIAFGVATIAVANFSMLKQTDTKKLIAFSSIEHMGMILIGIGIATKASLFWALLYTLGHSLAKVLLFLCAGIFNRQYDINEGSAVKDAIHLQPLASTGFIIGSVTLIGMPLFALFLPKLMLIFEIGKLSVLLMATILVLLIIGASSLAVYVTRILSNTSGANITDRKERYNVQFNMKLPIIILIILLIYLGINIPQGLESWINNIIASLGI